MQFTLLFSIGLNGYDKLFRNCIKSQKAYSTKFDYKYILINRAPQKMSGQKAAWLKIYLLREAMELGYKWIAFIDADCEIRQHTPDFRKYLENLDTDASTFMAHGFSGRINSGVIFMKNTIESKAYLDEVINNRNNPVPEEDKAPFENGHMITYGKNNASVKIIDNTLWNNNIKFDPESYIQHYSGGKLRPLYLRQQPLDNKIYQIRKKWNMLIGKNKHHLNIENFEKIVLWFKNEYTEFNSELN